MIYYVQKYHFILFCTNFHLIFYYERIVLPSEEERFEGLHIIKKVDV